MHSQNAVLKFPCLLFLYNFFCIRILCRISQDCFWWFQGHIAGLMLYFNSTEIWKMRPKMKYSTSKLSSAKLNNATGKSLVKTRKLPSKSVRIPVLHTTWNLSSNTYYADVQTCHLTKTPKNVRTDRKKKKRWLLRIQKPCVWRVYMSLLLLGTAQDSTSLDHSTFDLVKYGVFWVFFVSIHLTLLTAPAIKN